eukprot:4608268-Ditylum_brightwellii.AAC.1
MVPGADKDIASLECQLYLYSTRGELSELCSTLLHILKPVYHSAASCWHKFTGMRALPSTVVHHQCFAHHAGNAQIRDDFIEHIQVL